MTMAHSNPFASPQTLTSLRQEAATRASAASTSSQNEISSAFYSPTASSNDEYYAFDRPVPHTPQAQQQQQQQQQSHPLEHATPITESIALSARKEWRDHGFGITQTLEEKRRLDEERAGTITVRVISAETRLDISGKKYTAYVLRVTLPNSQIVQLERRYSDFSKLNEIFKSYRLSLDTSFPPKSMAGRMGNWTPSAIWAPEQHSELIEFRKIQFDVWLVHVVEKYNLGDLPHSVAHAIYDFLTLPDRPPCEQDNQHEETWKWNNPLSFTLGSSIRQATATLQHMCQEDDNHLNDQSIPLDLLQHAKGLCFLTVIKAGLLVSGRVGTGLLIARLSESHWSAPCALQTVGAGWGMLAGADITHYLVVLTTHDAVEALLHGTVQLGAELGVAVGPLGRGAQGHVSASNDNKWAVHPAYSYAHSQGLFMGISLEGSVLTARTDVNSKFYGRNIDPEQILDLKAPKAAEPLYTALALCMRVQIPEGSFRPSQLFNGGTVNSDSQGNNNTVASSTKTPSPIQGLPTIDTMGREQMRESMASIR
jgi:lipid-binding SYLF domain-containing protein